MNDKPSNGTEADEYIWTYGKSASHLPSSEKSMSHERKEIIRKALEFDIIDIRTYTGYKGDLLIEITTMDPHVIRSIKNIAENLGLDTVTKKDILEIHKIYCISASYDAYELKEDF